MMRIGIDFDNTIICYDHVFCHLAKLWQMIPHNFQGNKSQVREIIQRLPEGDYQWQRLQGKVYGEFIHEATPFQGFNEFITACHTRMDVDIFIVSHKTEFGHFDDKRINLRDVSRKWLFDQGLIQTASPHIPIKNIFFESTREEKIARIQSLQCTHFIDDLIEVLDSPLFPNNIQRILFKPNASVGTTSDDRLSSSLGTAERTRQTSPSIFSNWADITNAIFS